MRQKHYMSDIAYWICETCFNDFKDKFQWTVVKLAI